MGPSIQEVQSDIVFQTTIAVTVVKMLVDVVRLCWGFDRAKQPPTWILPISALGIGVVVMGLFGLAMQADLTLPHVLAKTALSGLVAGSSAIGVTELHNQARGGSATASFSAGPAATASFTAAPPAPVAANPPPWVKHQGGV